MKLTLLSSCLVLTLGAGVASAGFWHGPTEVYLDGNYAYGTLYDVRHSADQLQHIGCSTTVGTGWQYAHCRAWSADDEFIYCWSSDPGVIATAQSLDGNSFLAFEVDKNTGQCTYLSVETSSQRLP
jgi:hypothetical protein